MVVASVVLGIGFGWSIWMLGTAHTKLNALGRAAGIRFHPLTGQQVGTESHRDA